MSRFPERFVTLAVGLAVALTLADVSLAAEARKADVEFQITRPKCGEQLKPGKAYVAEGNHRRPMTTTAWLFVVDSCGGWYVQNPAIRLKRDSAWELTNLRPGTEIEAVVAIEVNSLGTERVRGSTLSDLGGLASARCSTFLAASSCVARKSRLPGDEVPPPQHTEAALSRLCGGGERGW
jgi:hypothetical protein